MWQSEGWQTQTSKESSSPCTIFSDRWPVANERFPALMSRERYTDTNHTEILTLLSNLGSLSETLHVFIALFKNTHFLLTEFLFYALWPLPIHMYIVQGMPPYMTLYLAYALSHELRMTISFQAEKWRILPCIFDQERRPQTRKTIFYSSLFRRRRQFILFFSF